MVEGVQLGLVRLTDAIIAGAGMIRALARDHFFVSFYKMYCDLDQIKYHIKKCGVYTWLMRKTGSPASGGHAVVS